MSAPGHEANGLLTIQLSAFVRVMYWYVSTSCHHRTRRLDTEQTIPALAAGSWSGTETAGRRLPCTL